jgi:phage replication initiation protein
MDSGFTLTIDWLAFTVLASNPQETMKVLGGDWSKAKGGFRGYPLSWMRVDGLRGVGKWARMPLGVRMKSMWICRAAWRPP